LSFASFSSLPSALRRFRVKPEIGVSSLCPYDHSSFPHCPTPPPGYLLFSPAQRTILPLLAYPFRLNFCLVVPLTFKIFPPERVPLFCLPVIITISFPLELFPRSLCVSLGLVCLCLKPDKASSILRVFFFSPLRLYDHMSRLFVGPCSPLSPPLRYFFSWKSFFFFFDLTPPVPFKLPLRKIYPALISSPLPTKSRSNTSLPCSRATPTSDYIFNDHFLLFSPFPPTHDCAPSVAVLTTKHPSSYPSVLLDTFPSRLTHTSKSGLSKGKGPAASTLHGLPNDLSTKPFFALHPHRPPPPFTIRGIAASIGHCSVAFFTRASCSFCFNSFPL